MYLTFFAYVRDLMFFSIGPNVFSIGYFFNSVVEMCAIFHVHSHFERFNVRISFLFFFLKYNFFLDNFRS